MDTPETRTRNKKEKAAGLEAKEFVKSVLLFADNIVEITTEEKGKFGRYLTNVWYFEPMERKKIHLNKQLIDEGHAIAYHGGKKIPYASWSKLKVD